MYTSFFYRLLFGQADTRIISLMKIRVRENSQYKTHLSPPYLPALNIIGCGDRTRTCDLRVMSPIKYTGFFLAGTRFFVIRGVFYYCYSIIIVWFALSYFYIFAVYPIYKPISIVNFSAPPSRPITFKRFGTAYTDILISVDVLQKLIKFFKRFSILCLPIQIIIPSPSLKS